MLGAEKYNNSGLMRGYPDVSANGAKYVVALEGSYDHHLYGTSASAPAFGAVVTLINEARMGMGNSSVGFISMWRFLVISGEGPNADLLTDPTLYAHPYLLNNITSGSNPRCGNEGFDASPGWDPITGLGTPSYPRHLKYVLTH